MDLDYYEVSATFKGEQKVLWKIGELDNKYLCVIIEATDKTASTVDINKAYLIAKNVYDHAANYKKLEEINKIFDPIKKRIYASIRNKLSTEPANCTLIKVLKNSDGSLSNEIFRTNKGLLARDTINELILKDGKLLISNNNLTNSIVK